MTEQSQWIQACFQYCLHTPLLYDLPTEQSNQKWLDQFRQTLPTPLPKNLPSPSPRLGLWYEQLWLALFNHHPDFEVLAYNQAIMQDKRTLGAIDFLLVDHHHQCVIHLEVAVKFYLHFCSQGPSAWLGPNPTDQLPRKISHMLRHQLPIGYHPFIQQLRSRYPHYRFVQQAIIQGRLFEPGHQLMDGGWLRITDLTSDQKKQLAYIKKLYWLTPEWAPNTPQPQNITQPIMVYAQGKQMMLVPEQWPQFDSKKGV
ncbi:DUF1853 family protein [Celerinatantimonas sp. YJH-8]|uniref:DUF1853 family protein n=1 Tax=Celerinatantimonas sp. YJH-8 TaxID=3228714 RepID=UPI0038C3F58C